MSDLSDKMLVEGRVLIGNVVLYPSVIRQQLVKSCYSLVYNPEGEELTLGCNHGSGGKTLFGIRNVPYESASKLAEKLGLEGEGEKPFSWSKWNPILHLYHDNSDDAERLRIEILKLGIPYSLSYRASEIALSTNQTSIYKSPSWTVEQMLEIIRETAKKYQKELNTTP